jgi:CubicO group peptidase (beta-lactamase class C family)
VLGLIVERVSGQSYYDFVRDHIFPPTGMTNTGYYGTNGEVPGGAVGYTRDRPAGALSDNLGSRELKGGAAGGGYSTVEDLRRFAEALTAGRLIRPETLRSSPRRATVAARSGFVTETHHGTSWSPGGAPGWGPTSSSSRTSDTSRCSHELRPTADAGGDELVREMITSR